jgi:glucose/mannose-6-phosphate isomerase
VTGANGSAGATRVDLDDAAAVHALDPGGMLGIVAGLAEQVRDGYARGRALDPVPSADDIASVAFCGMGGSAIAGDVLRVLAAPRLLVPVAVVRTPELPAFVGPSSVVIASSYSGGTAETLALFEAALARGGRTIALTSGGALAERAAAAGVPVVTVPGGLMPRAAFGSLTLATLGAFEAMGLLPMLADDVDEAVTQLDAVIASDGPEAATASNRSKAFALQLLGRVPIIWGAEGIGAVAASRWKAQFNENAKVPAFASALPELDHNEVVGWSAEQGDRFAVIALRHPGEHPDVASRFALSLEIAASSGALVEEVHALGSSALARLLTLVQVGDLISTYLGLARGVDPTPIEAIARLKVALSEA